MNRPAILATLMKQATEEGAELVTLRAIVEETSELAADRILERLGLDDAQAENDLGELRELLQAWRDAKASAWKAFIEWVIRAALALLLIGIAFRLGA
ncbi:MAG: DUF6127 family protein, partial [Erythrobacter sp.]|nr:DUF6127 family protein [Erythrobacter sp.]